MKNITLEEVDQYIKEHKLNADMEECEGNSICILFKLIIALNEKIEKLENESE